MCEPLSRHEQHTKFIERNKIDIALVVEAAVWLETIALNEVNVGERVVNELNMEQWMNRLRRLLKHHILSYVKYNWLLLIGK